MKRLYNEDASSAPRGCSATVSRFCLSLDVVKMPWSFQRDNNLFLLSVLCVVMLLLITTTGLQPLHKVKISNYIGIKFQSEMATDDDTSVQLYSLTNSNCYQFDAAQNRIFTQTKVLCGCHANCR